MLDAYIIDRIRREQEERQRGALVPLHIEAPKPPPPPRPDEDDKDDREPERGSVVIDFHL